MNIVPKSFQRLSRKEKITTVVLGATAVGGILLVLDRYARSTPRAYVNRFAVRGAWTDMASKLGITVGANLSVKTAQKYLNQIQRAGLAEDGVLGKATSNAIRKFQAGNGIEQSGVIDEETGNALQYFYAATSKSPAVQKTATMPAATPNITTLSAPIVTYTPTPKPWADAVTKDGRMGPPFTDALPMSIQGAQKALNDLMHFALPLTGVFDHVLEGAIVAFQAQNGLPPSGQLDSETSNALLYLATAAKAAMPHYPAPAAQAQAATPPPLSAAQKRQLAAAKPGAALDLGQGWVALAAPGGSVCACRKDDIGCLQSCGYVEPSQSATAWGPSAVGLQSTTMYDPRSYYGDPKPYWPATNLDFSEGP